MSELTEYKIKYHESLLRIQELEIDLDREKKKSEETKIQLEVAIKASERCETKRVTMRERVVAQSITAEHAFKERDYLKGQNRSLHAEVLKLKTDWEHSQNQVRDLLSSIDNFKKLMARNNTALEALQKQINLLEQDGIKLKSMFEKTKEFSHKAVMKVSLQSSSLKETTFERDSLKKQLYHLEGILTETKSKEERTNIQSSTNELDYQKEQMKIMEDNFNARLKNNEVELKNVSSALRDSLEAFHCLQAEHCNLKVIFSELEEELKAVKSLPKPADSSDAATDTHGLSQSNLPNELIQSDNSVSQFVSQPTQ